MNTLQFARWIWASYKLTYVEIGIWSIVMINFLDRRLHGRKNKRFSARIVKPIKQPKEARGNATGTFGQITQPLN